MTLPTPLAIYAARESLLERGSALAASLSLPLYSGDCPDGAVHLRLAEDGLSLAGEGLSVQGDFTKLLPRIRPANLSGELLVKAAKSKKMPERPRAVDATAGLGEDSFLLAAAGFDVTMFEYNPVIAALLRDALDRAATTGGLCGIVSRMHLTVGDSVEEMRRLDFTPDAVLLDPMFPGRQKSALVKKKFQLLHHLESPCDNGEEMLSSALACGARRILVKRPVKGPFLGGVKPSFSLSGKAVRIDCIVRG